MFKLVITSLMRSMAILVPILLAEPVMGIIRVIDSTSMRFLIAVSFFLLSFGIALTINRLTNILRG